MAIVSAIFKAANRKGYVSSTPAALAERPKRDPVAEVDDDRDKPASNDARPDVLDASEIRKLLDVSEPGLWHTLFATAAATGMLQFGRSSSRASARARCSEGGMGQRTNPCAASCTSLSNLHPAMNVGLDGGNPLFDGVCLDRIEEKSACRTSVVLDRVYHSIQPVQVAAPTQTSVIAFSRKPSSDISADTRASAYHQTNRFHVRSLLQSSAILD
jgi:hypothetical protein